MNITERNRSPQKNMMDPSHASAPGRLHGMISYFLLYFIVWVGLLYYTISWMMYDCTFTSACCGVNPHFAPGHGLRRVSVNAS
jgi:hypothetical protein